MSKNFSVPDLCDKYSFQVQIGTKRLTSFGKLKSFYGMVETIQCTDDNSFVKQILNTEGNGKVLVIDAGGISHASMIGEEIAKAAKKNNWIGILVNGCVRDIEITSSIDIGIYATSSIPLKTAKDNLGQVSTNIFIDLVLISPGDWIYVDENGWIVSKNKLKL